MGSPPQFPEPSDPPLASDPSGSARIGYALPPPPPPIPWTGWVPPYAGPRWNFLATPDGIASIRKGLGHYRIVVGLNLVMALLGLALIPFVGVPGAGFGGLTGGPSVRGFDLTGPSGGAIAALLAVGGIVGLIAFVMTIVAWSEWRNGLKTLLAADPERGEEYRRDVLSAHHFYTITWVAFLINLVGSGVLVAALIAQSVSSQLSGQGTGLATVTLFGGSPIPAVIIALAAFSGVVNIALYYSAGRSLVASIRALVSDPERAEIELGRMWILVAAVIVPLVAAAGFFSIWVSVGAVVPPAILLLGYSRILAVYDRWLASAAPPPPPTWPPAPSL